MQLPVFLLSLTCALAYVHVEKRGECSFSRGNVQKVVFEAEMKPCMLRGEIRASMNNRTYSAQGDILPGMLLEELANRMRKESDMSYLDVSNSNPLGSRSLEEEQYDPMDYDLGDAPFHPSIRDQEYLRHSSLWGSKYVGDGSAGSDNQRTKPQKPNPQVSEAKTKNTLPAYCNPPNPCPVGYDGEEGCIEDFENTAAFSRRFQDEQDCMCDSEHMFDCPDNTDPFIDDSMDSFNDLEFNQFVRQQIQVQGLHHKNLVAKKFNKDDSTNPFLSGERLPVAAKKGNRAL